MFTNSLIKTGTKKQVFGQQAYTQEELQYFLDNFDEYTEDQTENSYGFDMKTLSLLSSNNVYTRLLYNGEEIVLPSQIINDLIESNNTTYSSQQIEDKLTEIINTIGVGSGSGTAVVTQKTFLEVAIDDILNINSIDDKINLQNAIVQLYKFIPGTQDIVEIIKDFDNTEKESFYYNPENVEFTGVMKIKDRYPLNFTYNSTEGYYESEVINKSDFAELYGIEVS